MTIKRVSALSFVLLTISISCYPNENKRTDYTHSIHYYSIKSHNSKHNDQWCRNKYSSRKYLKINNKGVVSNHNLARKYIKGVALRKLAGNNSLSLFETDLGFSSVFCQKNVSECEGLFYNKYCYGSFSSYKLAHR